MIALPVLAQQGGGFDLAWSTINGVGFYTGFGSCTFFSGANWTCSSDRNLKENFTPVDEREILDRLNRVPITRWNMKGQDPNVHHLGPVAQDFYAAFGLGEDDEHINTGDAQGVAFAAIQGLYQVVQEKETQITAQQVQIDALHQENDDLAARVAALERTAGASRSSQFKPPGGWLLLGGLVVVASVMVRRRCPGGSGWKLSGQ